MPMTSVPLLVSQVLPPPVPVASSRFVPQAVSPRAPARIAAVTIVRLRVMLFVLPYCAMCSRRAHARDSRLPGDVADGKGRPETASPPAPCPLPDRNVIARIVTIVQRRVYQDFGAASPSTTASATAFIVVRRSIAVRWIQ